MKRKQVEFNLFTIHLPKKKGGQCAGIVECLLLSRNKLGFVSSSQAWEEGVNDLISQKKKLRLIKVLGVI